MCNSTAVFDLSKIAVKRSLLLALSGIENDLKCFILPSISCVTLTKSVVDALEDSPSSYFSTVLIFPLISLISEYTPEIVRSTALSKLSIKPEEALTSNLISL